nr:hypothetical protein CFP56_56918 [Quercus suber]POE80851.1 hypothetical protein CFP56_56924 [Quercus suber]
MPRAANSVLLLNANLDIRDRKLDDDRCFYSRHDNANKNNPKRVWNSNWWFVDIVAETSFCVPFRQLDFQGRSIPWKHSTDRCRPETTKV